MKDRPILFSAPMVSAILAGTKTQTRRVVKPQPPRGTFQLTPYHHPDKRPRFFAWKGGFGGAEMHPGWEPIACPYGQPGDRLWVRETHLIVGGADSKNPRVVYAATNDGSDAWLSPVWRPSIHMPRWASRITLEITSVRVERLQEISEADAIAEGIERAKDFPGWYRGSLPGGSPGLQESGHAFKTPTAFPKLAFRALWQSINGPESWDANPWVWVVEFKRVEAA